LLILACVSGRVAGAQDGGVPQAARMPTLPPAESPAAPAVWRADVLDAFVEAVDNRKPLVILFRNDPAEDPSRHGQDRIAQLKADGLTEFRDQAVFVELVFRLDAEGRDEYGCRLARVLEIDRSPSLSILAPNVDQVHEVFRDAGTRSLDELRIAFREQFPRALHVRHSWLPCNSGDLVVLFAEAMRTGDRRMHASCFAEPIRTRMLEVSAAQSTLGEAKRKMLAALDRRFGLQVERLPFIDDDEEMEEEMREVVRVEHGRATKRDSGVELEIRVTRAKKPGYDLQPVEQHSVETLPVVVERNAIRFSARDPEAFAKTLAEHAVRLKRIAAQFDAITAGVAAGRYATAAAARDQAVSNYRRRKSVAAR